MLLCCSCCIAIAPFHVFAALLFTCYFAASQVLEGTLLQQLQAQSDKLSAAAQSMHNNAAAEAGSNNAADEHPGPGCQAVPTALDSESSNQAGPAMAEAAAGTVEAGC